MKTIKLVHAPDPIIDKTPITDRLTKYLLKLRKNKLAREFIGNDQHSVNLGLKDLDAVADELSEGIALTWADRTRIRSRVERFVARRNEVSGLTHLKEKELQRLKLLITGVRLVEPKSEHWVDEVVSALHEEMPWMAPATQEVWRALRLNASAGDPVHLPPLLLNGPPGIGKSVWARRLSELLHMPRCEIDVSMGGVGFAIVGTERGWSTAQPGRPLENILQHRVGNPLIVIDEICKSRSVTTEKGSSHSFADSLLNLLEPATSVAWECPFYRTKIDMSHISWVLTANDTPMIPEPLLSRCMVINLRPITCAELKGFARRQAAQRKLTETSVEVIEKVIEQSTRERKPEVSLRDVVRILRRAEVLEGRRLQH